MRVFRCAVCKNTVYISEHDLNILKCIVKQLLNEEYEDSEYISALKTCCEEPNYIEVKPIYTSTSA